jgi:hypothetical protein
MRRPSTATFSPSHDHQQPAFGQFLQVQSGGIGMEAEMISNFANGKWLFRLEQVFHNLAASGIRKRGSKLSHSIVITDHDSFSVNSSLTMLL